MKIAMSALALSMVAGAASGQLVKITEVYNGLSGNDGTADWFELTNNSNAPVDTAGFYYDDDGPNIPDGGQLDSIVLAPGESAVFLISDEAVDITDFNAVWGFNPGDINVGLTNGGGNLGQGGDSVNVMWPGGGIVDTLVYTGAEGGTLETTERLLEAGSMIRLSVLGENGAFNSNAFTNENFPNNEAILVGSPGFVPAPGAAMLLALGGLVATRRR